MVKSNSVAKRRSIFRSIHITLFHGLVLWMGFGLLFGAVCAKMGWQSGMEQFSALLETNASRFSLPWYQSAGWYLLTWLLFFAVTFFCGFWAIGQPVILAAVLCKGIGLGSLICSLCLQQGWSGAGQALLLVIPSGLVGMFVLLISAKEALRFSTLLLKAFQTEELRPQMTHVRLYCLKHGLLLGILLAGALVDQSILCCYRFFIVS